MGTGSEARMEPKWYPTHSSIGDIAWKWNGGTQRHPLPPHQSEEMGF